MEGVGHTIFDLRDYGWVGVAGEIDWTVGRLQQLDPKLKGPKKPSKFEVCGNSKRSHCMKRGGMNTPKST